MKSTHTKTNTAEQEESPSYFKNTWNYAILGFCIGIIDSVPGISGSTVALLFRQYELILQTFNEICTYSYLKKFFKNVNPFKGILLALQDKKIMMIYLIGGGLLIGFAIFFTFIAFLVKNYELLMMRIFSVVMIGVSLYYIILHKKVFNLFYKQPKLLALCVVLFSIGLTIFLSIYEFSTINSTIIYITGVITMIAMVLPGVSGSLLLVLFGMYVPLKEAIYSFDLHTLSLYLLGSLTGLILSAKIISYASKRYSMTTKYVILTILLSSTVHLLCISWIWIR